MEPFTNIFGKTGQKQKLAVVRRMTRDVYNMQRTFYKRASARLHRQYNDELQKLREELYGLRLGKKYFSIVEEAINNLQSTLNGWAMYRENLEMEGAAPSSEGVETTSAQSVVPNQDASSGDNSETVAVLTSELDRDASSSGQDPVVEELVSEGLSADAARELVLNGKVADFRRISVALGPVYPRYLEKLAWLCIRTRGYDVAHIASTVKNRRTNIGQSTDEILDAVFNATYSTSEKNQGFQPQKFDLDSLGTSSGGGQVEPVLESTGNPSIDMPVAELKRRGDHLGKQENNGPMPAIDVGSYAWRAGKFTGTMTGETSRDAVNKHLADLAKSAWAKGYKLFGDDREPIEQMFAQLILVCLALRTGDKTAVSASGGGQNSADAPRLYADQTSGVVIKNPAEH